MSVLKAAEGLREACAALEFSAKVPYVYNPLKYAWDPHEAYVTKYGKGSKRQVILVGMNPGPSGMAQTGVPFGDVTKVRDWMGIEGEVKQPRKVHPKRPITGFATKRREPSGTRLYRWAEEQYGPATAFFKEFFVTNYCPLLFYDKDGKNLTPPQLRKADTEALYEVCDEALAGVVRALKPSFVVGVGSFATARVEATLAAHDLKATTGTVLHPSPANPKANRGWSEQATKQLVALGVKLPKA